MLLQRGDILIEFEKLKQLMGNNQQKNFSNKHLEFLDKIKQDYFNRITMLTRKKEGFLALQKGNETDNQIGKYMN